MQTLSIIIPVFNEEDRLIKTFWELKTLKLPRGLKLQEVIFVNDGSKDRTESIIQNFKHQVKNINLTLISYPVNQGKGYAVRQAMFKTQSDYALLCDTDMSTPLSEIKKLIPYFKAGTDVIIGTRKNRDANVIKHQSKIREFLGHGFTLMTKRLLGLPFTDLTCGFKAFSKNSRASIFTKSIINRWGYDAEILLLSKKANLSMAEKGVLWSNDQQTKVKIIQAVAQTLAEIAAIYWNHILKNILARSTQKLNIFFRYRFASAKR